MSFHSPRETSRIPGITALSKETCLGQNDLKKNEKLKNLYDSYVDGLREGADVQVNDGVLESLDLAPAIRGAHPMLEGMEGAMPGMPKAPSPRLELKRPPTAGDK